MNCFASPSDYEHRVPIGDKVLFYCEDAELKFSHNW